MTPPGKLRSFPLSTCLKTFIEVIWEEDTSFRIILTETGETEDSISISEWAKEIVESESEVFKRTIKSRHPLPWLVRLSLPWLPPDIISTNVQTMHYDVNSKTLLIRESSHIKGIPFVEPTITIDWEVRDCGQHSVECDVSLKFSYAEPFFLESLLESQASSEIGKLIDVIEKHAKRKIEEIEKASIDLPDLTSLRGLIPSEKSRTKSLSFKALDKQGVSLGDESDHGICEVGCSFAAIAKAFDFFS